MKVKPIKTNNTMKATKLNTVANTYANNLKCLFHTECINISHYEEYEANLLMREGEVLNHEDLPSLKGERIAYTCGTYPGNRAYVTEVTLGEVSRRADGTYDVLDENGKRTGLYYYDNIPFVMAGAADYQAIYKVIK